MLNVNDYINANNCLIDAPANYNPLPDGSKPYPYLNNRGRFDISLSGKSNDTNRFDFGQLIDLIRNRSEYPRARIRCKSNRPVTKPNGRRLISEIDWSHLLAKLTEFEPKTDEVQGDSIVNDDKINKEILPDPYYLDTANADERKRILANYAIREGQSKFRQALIDAQGGSACLISGCNVGDVVQAAHIMPYLGEKDNHIENGLLLRADLHLLFDKGILGINPETFEVHLSGSAGSDSNYFHLHGAKLQTNYPLSFGALQERWKWFQDGLLA
jgi:hypothetical protein